MRRMSTTLHEYNTIVVYAIYVAIYKCFDIEGKTILIVKLLTSSEFVEVSSNAVLFLLGCFMKWALFGY